MQLRKWAERFLLKFGFIKVPSGLGGISGGGGLLGFSSLGSVRKQCEAFQGHVYKCVSLIYRRAISVSMHLYKERGDEEEEIKRHPFLDLMRRPNPYMTGRDLKAITFMHRDLTGKAFWLLVSNSLGRPVEIWPLPVANFSRFVFNKAQTELLAYEFNTDAGQPVQYVPEEVVYFRYSHPIYMFDGASPIQAMAYAYDTDMALRVYQRNFFQNSVRPDVVFETDSEIQAEDARRLLLAWKQAHQGVDRAWEPAILDKGLKVNTLSVTAKDFEFAALAGWTKEDILEAYNVPPGKLGTVKDVNKANALGIDITFNSECIAPRLDSYEDQVNLSVLSRYDTGLFVQHDNCIPRDKEHDLKERETNLKTQYSTVNEERAREGREPVPWGDAPFVPINLIQYGEEAGIVRESEKESDERRVTSDERRDQNSLLVTRNLSLKDRAEHIRLGHERRVAARSRIYRSFLRKFFKGLLKEVLDNLERVFPRIDGVISGMSIAKAKTWLDEHKDLADQCSFNMTGANKNLIDGSWPYIEGTLLMGGEEALSALEIDVTFDIFSPQAVEFMKTKTIILKDVNRVTHDAILKTLREGFETGDSMRDMAARVRKVFDSADKARSLRIAQTEINSAANFGTLEGYRQSGAVEGKEWIAGPGARETHIMAAAEYSGDGAIPLHQDFHVGDGYGPAPGSIGLPEEDINCRCTILPVVRKE